MIEWRSINMEVPAQSLLRYQPVCLWYHYTVFITTYQAMLHETLVAFVSKTVFQVNCFWNQGPTHRRKQGKRCLNCTFWRECSQMQRPYCRFVGYVSCGWTLKFWERRRDCWQNQLNLFGTCATLVIRRERDVSPQSDDSSAPFRHPTPPLRVSNPTPGYAWWHKCENFPLATSSGVHCRSSRSRQSTKSACSLQKYDDLSQNLEVANLCRVLRRTTDVCVHLSVKTSEMKSETWYWSLNWFNSSEHVCVFRLPSANRINKKHMYLDLKGREWNSFQNLLCWPDCCDFWLLFQDETLVMLRGVFVDQREVIPKTTYLSELRKVWLTLLHCSSEYTVLCWSGIGTGRVNLGEWFERHAYSILWNSWPVCLFKNLSADPPWLTSFTLRSWKNTGPKEPCLPNVKLRRIAHHSDHTNGPQILLSWGEPEFPQHSFELFSRKQATTHNTTHDR